MSEIFRFHVPTSNHWSKTFGNDGTGYALFQPANKHSVNEIEEMMKHEKVRPWVWVSHVENTPEDGTGWLEKDPAKETFITWVIAEQGESSVY